MVTLDGERMFVAVIETGSFSRAAARLGTTSGQASKRVAALEADLGARLLNRTTRAVSPTEVGRAYYARIRPLLDDYDAIKGAVRSTAGQVRGRLRLSVPMSFGTAQLAPILIDFAREYPQVELDADFTDRAVNLVEKGFDMAVRVGAATDTSLIARKLCDMRVVVVASPAYLASRGEPAEPAVLKDHPCILDTNFSEPHLWRFKSPRDGRPMTVPVDAALRFSSAEVCRLSAEAGLGITRIPSFIAGASLRDGRLRPLFGAYEEEPIRVVALYPPGRYLTLQVRALVDFLAARFKGTPVWDRDWAHA